ncbi:MAG: GerAB/ArcD/ProY family transporter [Turicibacter sp.]
MNFTIRPFQLAIILYLARSYNMLTNSNYSGTYSSLFISVFLSFFIQLIFLIPIFSLYKKNNKTNPISIAYDTSPTIGKLTGLTLFLFSFSMCFDTLSGFEMFMTNTVFPYANQYVIIIPLVIVAIYGVLNGLNPLLRTATLIFPFTILVLIIITGFSLKNTNFYLLKPILENPCLEIMKSSFLLTLRNFELIPLIYLLDRIPQGKRKAIFGFLIPTTLIHAVRVLSITLVLGNYANIQLYASYALASLVEASIFQRLDSIYTIIWVFMAFIRFTFYFWICLDILPPLVSKKFHGFILPLTAISLVLITLWKISFYSFNTELIIYFITTALFVISLLLLPCSILFIQLLKKGRSEQC